MRCPETSVNNYHTTPRNIPEECRCHWALFFSSHLARSTKVGLNRNNLTQYLGSKSVGRQELWRGPDPGRNIWSCSEEWKKQKMIERQENIENKRVQYFCISATRYTVQLSSFLPERKGDESSSASDVAECKPTDVSHFSRCFRKFQFVSFT
jgi:hypothetical protein